MTRLVFSLRLDVKCELVQNSTIWKALQSCVAMLGACGAIAVRSLHRGAVFVCTSDAKCCSL